MTSYAGKYELAMEIHEKSSHSDFKAVLHTLDR
jgi:hypothetical protein